MMDSDRRYSLDAAVAATNEFIEDAEDLDHVIYHLVWTAWQESSQDYDTMIALSGILARVLTDFNVTVTVERDDE